MPQSLANVLVHLIYSTKHRQPRIHDDIRVELHAYLSGILHAHACPSIIINSVEDHLHILFALSKRCALADIIEEVKTGSSKWIKSKGPAYANFFWQAGYGAFAVSENQREMVMHYIATQQEHHRRISLQDELRYLFTQNGIAYDERYLWD